ncbi:MAG: thioredoxin family protein [Sulfurospirillaceae bacterium]|nr:thioredoxin family protein [Sulfurospirillaceae bacterium]
MKKVLIFVVLFILSLSLNADYKTGKEIFAKKCASCHTGYIPGKILEENFYKKNNKLLNLTAPTVNMIAYAMKDSPTHIGDKSDPDMQKIEMNSYLQDYLYHPNRNNSICDKSFLKYYAIKKSMKGQVSEDEIAQITDYLFDYKKMRLLEHPKAKKVVSGELDTKALLKKAKDENKTIIIEAMSQTCHFCQTMKADVLSKKIVQDAIKKDFIFVQIDIDKTKLPFDLTKKYQKITPSFFTLTPDGKFLNSYPGAWKTDDFLEILKENKNLR